MLEWLQTIHFFWWAMAFSLATLLISLVVVPILVARMPADYFSETSRPQRPWPHMHPVIRYALIVGKNVIGVLLIVVGLIMIPLPGQGVLTLLIGLMMVDFKQKYRFEKWLISREKILKTVNWIRHRAGREAIILDG